ncbi:MAG: Xaa-Pro aminopeptidase [Bacteroidales bacterium]
MPTPIPSTFFSGNRRQLIDRMVPGTVAIVCASVRMPRNADQLFPFRQDSSFYYLTGLEEPDAVLVLCRGEGLDWPAETLFMSPKTPRDALWNGPGLERDQVVVRTGIERTENLNLLHPFLESLIPSVREIYTPAPEPNDPLTNWSDRKLLEWIRQHFPGIGFRHLEPILMRLRGIKQPEELAQIREAVQITERGLDRVLHHLEPGMREYQVEALLIGTFRDAGARGHAFEPIVASGANALVLHYTDNTDPCRDGDLLLLDFGAEVNNYAADCSRTLPVSGRFTRRQRDVYEATLRVFRQARDMMICGAVLADLHNRVGTLWEEEHIRLGLYSLREARASSPESPLWKRYFPHGTSHSLGLDVHDLFDRNLPLEEDMVLTCEPGIYIPEEGLGIRIENDIRITAGEPEDLMEGFPLEPDEIEHAMKKRA